MRKEKAKAYYTVDIDKTNSVDTVLATVDLEAAIAEAKRQVRLLINEREHIYKYTVKICGWYLNDVTGNYDGLDSYEFYDCSNPDDVSMAEAGFESFLSAEYFADDITRIDGAWADTEKEKIAKYDMVQRLKANRDKECLSILAL